eukprot:TRINITY_DN3748_c0_g1_i1.p1 TRINITY_DN3748_c0_g1~~TRINITY_DN3748_c0_g1_i1.p1  ORF type:complete len:199 (-),score=11.71 TRINITY_DN3748_c0_g1_i1:695-1291(-)
MCKDNISLEETKRIAVFTLIFAFLSMVGSSFMILNYLAFSKKKGLSKLVFFLSVSDYAWSIREISHCFVIIFDDYQFYSFYICVLLRVIFQFFSSASVFWTLCIAIHLYSQTFRWNYSENFEDHHMKLYHLISWGIPALACIVMVAGKYIVRGPGEVCIPEEPAMFLFWFAPLILAIVITSVLYPFDSDFVSLYFLNQ